MTPVERRTILPLPVAPPPIRAERRSNLRRAEDRAIDAALAFTVRASGILASDGPAGGRLAALLALVAQTAHARRVAVLVQRPERHLIVAVAADESPRDALDLAAWLDATTVRPRAERVAAAPAPVTIVVLPGGRPGSGGRAPKSPVRVAVPVEGGGAVVLGLELGSGRSVAALETRLPPRLVRQAAGMLAIATRLTWEERAISDLRRTDAERKHFVSTVAHELRTPLTGLGGYFDLLLDGDQTDAEVREEFLERSRRIVETMTELVSDLLELSRIEAGALELSIGVFPLADPLTGIRDEIEPIAAGKRVALTVAVPSRLRTALGDRRRVHQVLANIVENAVKYTPTGGAVAVDAAFDGPVALLLVRDTGPGIESTDRDRVFERFERLDAHRDVPGTGLGLSIARDVARLMGGDIGVASVPRRGSTFIVALPGPSDPDPDTVRAALARALVREQARLDALDGRPPFDPLAGEVIHHPRNSSSSRG